MTFDPQTDTLYIQDVTLRDGMHALRHKISTDNVKTIAKALDAAGVDAIEVSHGDGLSGSSLNYGLGSNTDWEWLEAVASVLDTCVLTTLLIPGIGTCEDLHRAFDLGVRSVRVATHCTEADISKQHIDYARNLGMDVSGFLMMSHMSEPDPLAAQAKLMEDYGANCIYLTDSGGAMTMRDIRARMQAYARVLSPKTQRGIHAHHNLSSGCRQFHCSRRRRSHPDRCQPDRARSRGRELPSGSLHRGCRPYGLEARHGPVRPDGRGGRAGQTAAGTPRARGP